LRLIDAGGRYLPQRVAEIAASRFAREEPAVPPSHPLPSNGTLTDRQLTVLRLAADGRSNKEIALSLGLSPATIKTHLAMIQVYLGARNRTDAAARARSLNLL
jgi:DNA-binding NarL/FixJ family response regulator